MFARLQILGLALIGSALIGCQAPLGPIVVSPDSTHLIAPRPSIAGPSEIRVKGRYTWIVQGTGQAVGSCNVKWSGTFRLAPDQVPLGLGDSQAFIVEGGDGDFLIQAWGGCLGTVIVEKLVHVEIPAGSN